MSTIYRNGTYEELDPRITYKPDGGYYIFWKGVDIEHFNKLDQLDKEMEASIIQRCEFLESLGVGVRCNTYCWHWSWFENCPKDSIYLPLLRLCPGLYEHGMTPERQAAMVDACCPKYRIVEPDGSIIFQFTNKLGVHWRPDNIVTAIEIDDTDPNNGWYHQMAALDYHTVVADQRVSNGSCYATYAGLAKYFEEHHVTAASVAAVLECFAPAVSA